MVLLEENGKGEIRHFLEINRFSLFLFFAFIDISNHTKIQYFYSLLYSVLFKRVILLYKLNCLLEKNYRT